MSVARPSLRVEKFRKDIVPSSRLIVFGDAQGKISCRDGLGFAGGRKVSNSRMLVCAMCDAAASGHARKTSSADGRSEAGPCSSVSDIALPHRNSSNPEGISIRRSLQLCGFERGHRSGVIEPDYFVELLRQIGAKVVACHLGFGSVDPPDRPFQPLLAETR